jgi:hypothetical protein
MATDSYYLTVSNTVDLQEGAIVAGDVIQEGSSIKRIINITVIEISKPVLPIIGNLTRPIAIIMEPEPLELEEDPNYIQLKRYLYVKSPVFPDPVINYEYQINEIIAGTGGGNADIKNIEYFTLVRDETATA